MESFPLVIATVIDKRQLDIAMAKRVVLLGRSVRQRSTLSRSCVLMIYASLEGGVKEMCRHYLSSINLVPVQAVELAANYLYFASKKSCKFDQAVGDHERGVLLSSAVREFMHSPVVMPTTIDVESNLTPRVVSGISKSLGLGLALDNNVEANLNQLLRFRNNIAHGDQEMPLDDSRIDRFSDVAQSILAEFGSSLCRSYEKKVWLLKSQERSY